MCEYRFSLCVQLDECEKMQKDVYLALCQRFISVLGDHLARCDQQGSDYETPWFQATIDNFRQLLVKVNTLIFPAFSTIIILMHTVSVW